jgi:hypothetical protein
VEVGFFRKTDVKSGLFLQFPDGSIIESQSDMDRLMSDHSFTPSTSENWRLNASDTEAIAEASAMLASIGFNEEPFFAVGPVQLKDFPKSRNTYIANAILTPNYLIVYYQKNLLVPDFLILPLVACLGMNGTGAWSAQFIFKKGIHRFKSGAEEKSDLHFGLSERLGKDGQANRRSVTFMRSLGNTLDEVHRQ